VRGISGANHQLAERQRGRVLKLLVPSCATVGTRTGATNCRGSGAGVGLTTGSGGRGVI